jgi:TonB family protein
MPAADYRPNAIHADDILDRDDPMGRFFTGSLLLHCSLVGAVFLAQVLAPKPIILGGPTHGGGAIGVSVTKTIPIAQHEGRENRVANDTKSTVPQPPAPKKPPKATPVEKAPPKDAILLPSKQNEKKRKTTDRAYAPYTPDEPYKKNQIYGTTPQSLKSDQYGIQGNNGVAEGPSNPFGERFGWYTSQLRDRIAQKWNRSGVSAARNARTTLEITLLRDGTVREVKIIKPSGSYTLDNSAQRAVLDAAPLPPFPPGFPASQVLYDLSFGLEQ